MAKKYAKQADFKIVYVREAHPSDGWQVPQNERQGVIFKEPKTAGERAEVASACAEGLKISIPIVIDNMDDRVERAYAGWPDRIYIIGKNGKVVFRGRPGPAGFRLDEAETALRTLLRQSGPLLTPRSDLDRTQTSTRFWRESLCNSPFPE